MELSKEGKRVARRKPVPIIGERVYVPAIHIHTPGSAVADVQIYLLPRKKANT